MGVLYLSCSHVWQSWSMTPSSLKVVACFGGSIGSAFVTGEEGEGEGDLEEEASG